MPELPELEVLKEEITSQVAGKRVAGVVLNKVGKTTLAGEELIPQLRGSRLEGAQRRGKMLVLSFDSGLSLMVHFMLIGYMGLVKGGPPNQAPLALQFEDGMTLEIKQVALRSLHLLKRGEVETLPAIAQLGLDPLAPDFTVENLRQRLGKKGAIKALLRDQSLVAGLGNTYSDEVLFAARIHPERDGCSLTPDEWAQLHSSIDHVLRKAIELGGSSAEQFRHLDGSPGHYHEHYQAHRRGGEPCPRCGTPIVKAQRAGRSYYFCRQCQPL
ncbi:MAG: DNA-formamidopyrimidine glycosylase [Chloroflexi bacterium]|nr:DNA-formamidopyrimidine glycosylase [Chloroflexota bacterium]